MNEKARVFNGAGKNQLNLIFDDRIESNGRNLIS
jgi:hypothetical protein